MAYMSISYGTIYINSLLPHNVAVQVLLMYFINNHKHPGLQLTGHIYTAKRLGKIHKDVTWKTLINIKWVAFLTGYCGCSVQTHT